MDKAVSKALDRLRRPDARLVLTYVNDGSSVTGRAYFIAPGGYRVMDQTAQQLLERDLSIAGCCPVTRRVGSSETGVRGRDDHGAA